MSRTFFVTGTDTEVGKTAVCCALLQAARAAGMRTVGVLTGMAGPEDLMPYADVVLPDIGHIPGWLGHS